MSPPGGSQLDSVGQRPQAAREPTELHEEMAQPVSYVEKRIVMSCHCNRINDTFRFLPSRAFSKSGMVEIDINHHYDSRKFSGQLAVSYFPSCQPEVLILTKTVCFRLGEGKHDPTLYFCPVCGCHLFKEEWETIDGEVFGPTWTVATGVVEQMPKTFTMSRHINVNQTGDGGLSIWMRARNDNTIIPTDIIEQNSMSLPAKGYAPWSPTPYTNPPGPGYTKGDTLEASCFCGTVKFHVTRPTQASTLPKSQYPDLMIPYHTKSDKIPNPEDKKWWIRGPHPDNTGPGEDRYLAGTCACTSCRRCSGFDIQSWAFIPRANIFMRHSKKQSMGLDFANLPAGMLRSYSSSPGVTREFCPGCGATVFWHNTDRPELIDVSVGLFNDPKGVRAEDWLDWWAERVSFAEDRCEASGLLWDPVACLATGLKGYIEARAGVARSMKN